MTTEPSDKFSLPDPPRVIALMVLAGIAMFVVFSFHKASWPAFIVTLVIGSFFGFMAGGLVEIHLFPSLAAFAAFAVIFEGIFQGWSRYGFLGAMAGLAAGVAIGMLPIMLLHAAVLVFGGRQIVIEESSEMKEDESS